MSLKNQIRISKENCIFSHKAMWAFLWHSLGHEFLLVFFSQFAYICSYYNGFLYIYIFLLKIKNKNKRTHQRHTIYIHRGFLVLRLISGWIRIWKFLAENRHKRIYLIVNDSKPTWFWINLRPYINIRAQTRLP